jgi:hypothetical protein
MSGDFRQCERLSHVAHFVLNEVSVTKSHATIFTRLTEHSRNLRVTNVHKPTEPLSWLYVLAGRSLELSVFAILDADNKPALPIFAITEHSPKLAICLQRARALYQRGDHDASSQEASSDVRQRSQRR